MIFFYFFDFADLLFVGFWLCWLEILKSENLGFSGSVAASSAGCTANEYCLDMMKDAHFY